MVIKHPKKQTNIKYENKNERIGIIFNLYTFYNIKNRKNTFRYAIETRKLRDCVIDNKFVEIIRTHTDHTKSAAKTLKSTILPDL